MLQKLILTGFLVSSLSAVSFAQTIKTPAPSSTQLIKQELGIGSVELSYSRPNMKGRKIFGDLVPYGEVWRTGANNATTLTFTEDVMIGSTKIQAGKYGLLTIPNSSEWTAIITKQLDVTNPAAYKREQDVVRINLKPQTLTPRQETFTMQFANVRSNSADLQISWDDAIVSLPITMDVDNKVMAQINNVMNKDNRPYFQAALYYLDNGKDLNQALTWFDKALEQQPDAYYIHHQKANALARLGRKNEAKLTAQKSMELARKQNNMDYVRLNEKLIATL